MSLQQRRVVALCLLGVTVLYFTHGTGWLQPVHEDLVESFDLQDTYPAAYNENAGNNQTVS